MMTSNIDNSGRRSRAVSILTGGLIGLALGGTLAILAVSMGTIDYDSLNLGDRVLSFLWAIPPFVFAPLYASPSGAIALLLAWWTVVGALLGWCIGHRNVAGWIWAFLVVVVLLAGHTLALQAIGSELDAIESAVRALFTS